MIDIDTNNCVIHDRKGSNSTVLQTGNIPTVWVRGWWWWCGVGSNKENEGGKYPCFSNVPKMVYLVVPILDSLRWICKGWCPRNRRTAPQCTGRWFPYSRQQTANPRTRSIQTEGLLTSWYRLPLWYFGGVCVT